MLFVRWLFLVVVELACVARAAAESPAWLAQVQPAVVMIENRGHGGGSGTLVAENLVLTCDHLFRNSQTRATEVGRVVVSLASGEGSEAEVLAQDPVWDLALLRLKHPPRATRPVPLAGNVPQPGEVVVSCGYGGRGQVQANIGRVQGFGYDKERSTATADTLIISGTARGGDSGGPMFNERGELCGVLWGASATEVVGTQCGRCWQFGAPYLAPGGQRSPTAVPPTVPAVGSPASEVAELAKLREEIAKLREQLNTLERTPGPAGPPGPPGAAGKNGAGAEALDLDRLAQRVKQRLAGSIRIRVEPMPPQ